MTVPRFTLSCICTGVSCAVQTFLNGCLKCNYSVACRAVLTRVAPAATRCDSASCTQLKSTFSHKRQKNVYSYQNASKQTPLSQHNQVVVPHDAPSKQRHGNLSTIEERGRGGAGTEHKSQNSSHFKVNFLSAEQPSPLTFSTPVFGSIPTSQTVATGYGGTGTMPMKRYVSKTRHHSCACIHLSRASI